MTNGFVRAFNTYRSVSPLSLLLVLRPPLLLQVLLPVAAAPFPAAVPLRFGRFRRRRPELLVRGVLEVVRVSVVAAEPAAGEEVVVVALERKEESVFLFFKKKIQRKSGFSFSIYLPAPVVVRVPVVVPLVGAVVVFLLDLWRLRDRPVRVDVVVNQAGELARVRPPVVQGPWGRNEMLSYYGKLHSLPSKKSCSLT